MISVLRLGTDECDLFGKEAEGVYVKYTDGTEGFLSKKALWQLLAMEDRKREKKGGTSADRPRSGGASGAIG